MRFISLAVLSLILLTSSLAAAPFEGVHPEPITLEEYWGLVERTRSTLLDLHDRPADEIRVTIDGLADEWLGVSEVRLDDGTVVAVDISFLVASLRVDPPELERLEGLLGALLEAHEAYPQNVFDLSDLDSLKAILSQPEFQWRPNPIGEWLQKMWDKFMEWLDRLFGGNGGGSVTVRGGTTPFTVLALILLLLILAYIFRGLFADLVGESALEPLDQDNDSHLTSETALKKAQTFSASGDYRTAVRYLYLSSLLMLDERGLLRYDRSRTNREYIHNVTAHPNLARPLRSVVEVFDRVWYGFEPLDEPAYREYAEEVDELKEQRP